MNKLLILRTLQARDVSGVAFEFFGHPCSALRVQVLVLEVGHYLLMFVDAGHGLPGRRDARRGVILLTQFVIDWVHELVLFRVQELHVLFDEVQVDRVLTILAAHVA